MTIKARQKLVSPSKYPIKCPFNMTAEYITIHNTANDASAENEIAYMIRNDNQVSYHFAIDDKEVVQGIPLNRNAWHCGDGRGNGNMKSIGIEICYSKSGGQRYIKAEELAVKFVAQLLHERGWSISKVRKHQDWSGKYCPHRILSEGRWNSFLKRIKAELDKLNKTPPTKISENERLLKLTNPYMRGDDVKQLQENLNSLGYNVGDIDGIFGTKTESAVKAFQRAHNLTVDGVVGTQTLKTIKELLKLFKDVDKNHWAYEAIKYVKEKRIMNGHTDGTFRPDAPVTRAELATVIYNMNKK